MSIPVNMNFPNVTDLQTCSYAEHLHGDGPPPASLGDPGATYVDDLVDALYWKSETGWNPADITPPVIKTPPLNGSGPPADDLGNPGDVYTDNDTGALYWKSVNGWFPKPS